MRTPPRVRPPRSRRRRATDLVVSMVMAIGLIALYLLVVSRGHLPL